MKLPSGENFTIRAFVLPPCAGLRSKAPIARGEEFGLCWGNGSTRLAGPKNVAHHVTGNVGRGEFLAQLVQWPTIIVGDGNDVAHCPTHAWQLSLHNDRLAVADQRGEAL